MANQTKIGFVTLILLVGCIFAIPHFRHPLGSQAQSTDEVASESITLKLKMSPSEKSATKNKLVASSGVAVERGLPEQRIAERPSARVDSAGTDPLPSADREQWKFPPITRSQTAIEAEEHSPRQNPLPPDSRLIARNDVADNRPRPYRITPEAMATLQAGEPVRSLAPLRPTDLLQPDPVAQADPRAATSERRRTMNVRRSETIRPQETRGYEEPALHRIVNGDTLENLALEYYGDPRKAVLIFESNRDALLNPAILPLGVDLKIPNVE